MRWLAALALGALAACETNPITGRSQFMVVSEDMAIGQSAAAYSSMMGDLGKKRKVEADSPRAEKVRHITDRLIAQAVRFRPDSAKWKWEVQVINDPKTVNAFCMAGGKMAIYSGMWEKLKATDDEVAQVMGHEIGHALANHTQERMSIAYSTSIGTQLAAIALGARDQTAALMQQAAVVAIQLPNSRESESEADQIGIELAARAGYDPAAAVSLWDKMGKLGGTPPEFLSTHPSPEHRKETLQALGARMQPLYLAAKSANPGDAPSFLSSKEAVNERVVTQPGEPTREEFAARVANEPTTMSFLAEPFEKFKRGETVFDCRAQCAFSYSRRTPDWKKLHGRKQWRDLAVAVLQVGYLGDLSYFMLAEAARGLGLREAASAYYKRALDAGKEYGCGGDCEGFEVHKLAQAALKER
ncbi:MAG: M48 family metallopeptidase [Betaproteobacteria bacterium]|nr:MAG: M48 family metallopeptidase [Betaproteobacteria bacterium]